MHKATVAAAAGLAALFISTGAMAGKDLDAVKARGALICGIGQGTAGFMLQDSQGKWIGLDVDVCRAVAAAIFGDCREGQVRAALLAAALHRAAVGRGRHPVQQHDHHPDARHRARPRFHRRHLL